MMEARMPPGFRFHPRDDELVLDYLLHKLSGHAHGGAAMIDVDLNKCEPWDLPGVPPILDGDMLVQFLELTGEQQQAILAHPLPGKAPRAPVSVFQVLRTLERVHYALN
nr:unnamed protein product [Digitaria exilis]